MDKLEELKEKRIKKEENETRLFYGCILLVFTIFIGLWCYNQFANCVTSSDAIIEGRLVSAVPRVEGVITRLNVIENQEIKKGDLIAEVDVSRYEYKLKLAEANLNTTKIKYASAIGKYYEDLDDAYESAPNMESRFKFAKIGYEMFVKNNKSINSVTTEQEKDKSVLLDKKNDKPENIAKKEDKKDELTQEKNNKISENIEVKQSEEEEKINPEELRMQIKKLESDIAEYKLAISYSKIYAPCDGLVSVVSVSENDYIYVSQKIITIIPKRVWVTANFDESQVENIQVGQAVRIKVRDIKGKTFKGMVDSIQRNSNEYLYTKQGASPLEKVVIKIYFTEDYSEYNFTPGMYAITTVKLK